MENLKRGKAENGKDYMESTGGGTEDAELVSC